jgi:hypothetical protein
MKMNDTRGPATRPCTQRPAELKKVKGRFVVLSFNKIYAFIFNQRLSKPARLPRESLSGKIRSKKEALLLAEPGVRLARPQRSPILKRHPVDDQPPLARLLQFSVCSFPHLTDHMNGLSRLGQKP